MPVFSRELGMTPARYVEQIRIEPRGDARVLGRPPGRHRARVGLRLGREPRRTFGREMGITPYAFRQRFVPTGIDRLAG